MKGVLLEGKKRENKNKSTKFFSSVMLHSIPCDSMIVLTLSFNQIIVKDLGSVFYE